jgi:hypothetical protein
MTALRPFWRYFGGKWAAAGHYPEPRYPDIIEPFAGAAGYACHYPDHRVTLIDKSPVIAGIWRYLIAVSPEEILAIPDIPEGGTVDDLPCCQEARWLAGFWCNNATSSPCRVQSAWAREWSGSRMIGWDERPRRRIARQVPRIRHWRIIEGSYQDAPHIEATWMVDPPYQVMGKHYPHHLQPGDYADLGEWCRTLRGQVMVCEAAGADWLPFVPMATIKGTPGKGRTGVSHEVVWPGEGTQTDLLGALAPSHLLG